MAYFSATGTGGSGGNEPVLLWTNPNPTSSFSAQEIQVDEYDAYIIKSVSSLEYAQERNWFEDTYFDVSLNRADDCVIVVRGYSNAYNMRNFYKSENGITFKKGFRQYSTQRTDNNVCAVPIEIYGIKKAII